MFKRKGGGGVKGLLNNVKKNCTFLTGGHPLSEKYAFSEARLSELPIGMKFCVFFRG